MNRVEQYLDGKLNERVAAGNLRRLSGGRAGIDLYSNDYLGLSTTGLLSGLMRLSTDTDHATGSTGSRLLSGNSIQAEALEDRIASFHKAEAALLFNSGYDANVGLMACISGKDSVILSDELCHASLLDGIRLSLCRNRYKFRHNDLNDLEIKLKKFSGAGPVIIVVESVYSMDGDTAPLIGLVQLCALYDASLVVDEAHATGVFGNHGEGLVCALGLQDKVFARIHTFGKALGCHGAAVTGSCLLKQYLVNFARTFIYTTALPGHSIHAIQSAYQHLAGDSFDNGKLHHLISCFRKKINESGQAGWKDSASPIQAFVTGGNEQCRYLAEKIQQAGMQVNPILHPTVPLGMERLRICLHMFNTEEEITRLFDVIGDEKKKQDQER